MSLFDLYKNGVFVSSFHSIDEAEQVGKNIMRDMSLRNVYVAVYPKNANGKGQPLLEQVRGTGVNQLFSTSPVPGTVQIQQHKPDNFSTPPLHLRKPPGTPSAELPWFMQKPPDNWYSKYWSTEHRNKTLLATKPQSHATNQATPGTQGALFPRTLPGKPCP